MCSCPLVFHPYVWYYYVASLVLGNNIGVFSSVDFVLKCMLCIIYGLWNASDVRSFVNITYRCLQCMLHGLYRYVVCILHRGLNLCSKYIEKHKVQKPQILMWKKNVPNKNSKKKKKTKQKTRLTYYKICLSKMLLKQCQWIHVIDQKIICTVKPVLRDHCQERNTCIERRHLWQKELHFNIWTCRQTHLSHETTFYGRWGSHSRQVALYLMFLLYEVLKYTYMYWNIQTVEILILCPYSTDYTTIRGPNPSLRKGRDPSMCSGPGNLATGPDPDMAKGSEKSAAGPNADLVVGASFLDSVWMKSGDVCGGLMSSFCLKPGRHP